MLCLHSNASSSSQWRGLMELLSPHWRVLAPDLLGAGRSAAWPVVAGARLQHELDALAPVLQSLGDRFHVVGHSYGAALAMAIAQAAPQQVASAVLFEPTAFALLNRPGPGDPAATGIAAVATAAIAAVDQGDLPAAAEEFIDYWMGPGSWAAMPVARRGPVAESMRPIRQWTDAIFAESWPAAGLARMTMPVLLLGGDQSPASARDLLPILAPRLPQVTVQVLPGVGHMAPVTHPERVNPRIADFLEHRTKVAS
ncbi:MAG: alpha/beta hydrolase [Candidatus Nanopelagicales bacterium]|nr:alpha/beta hydrolase [Candidatus Nanopelagicales bacterium]